MIFSPSNIPDADQHIVKIGNQIIKRIGKNNEKDNIKFLGIALDENLSWKQHISVTCTKISRATYAINRAKNFLTHKALKILYQTLVQSHLQYGTIAWGNSTNIKQLDHSVAQRPHMYPPVAQNSPYLHFFWEFPVTISIL